jgi:hypothetical protein
LLGRSDAVERPDSFREILSIDSLFGGAIVDTISGEEIGMGEGKSSAF